MQALKAKGNQQTIRKLIALEFLYSAQPID